MSYTAAWLSKILGEIQAEDHVLKETRKRRDLVLSAAGTFTGALRTFRSGSVAHGTVIKPVSDGDGGGVLDRRSFPTLGPDGDGVGPRDIVSRARDHVLYVVRPEYSKVTAEITKRAILVAFHEPLSSGEDPTVDLVMALTRREAEGLWIPNTELNTWSASHPEKHTELLVDVPRELRVLRARVVRLVKAWNKQYTDPAMSSFNIEALALLGVVRVGNLETALAEFFTYSAGDLARRLTPDPANVSPPIKCPDRELAVLRLQTATTAMRDALSNDRDEDRVKTALSRVFGEYVTAPSSSSKAGFASAVRANGVKILGGLASTSSTAKPVNPVRSFGDNR